MLKKIEHFIGRFALMFILIGFPFVSAFILIKSVEHHILH